MKIFIIYLVAFCLTANAMDISVIFPHPLIDLGKTDTTSDSTFFPDYYLQTRPLTHNENELLSHFEKAQSYYAVRSFDMAKVYYTKVSNLQFTDDWKEAHRKAIALSLSRLAELDPTQKDTWIQRAASFTSNSSSSSLEWDVREWKHDFDFILMNGHKVDLNSISKVRLPQGEYRIVFLSKTYAPQTLQVTSQQIPFLQPIKIPFVSGTCKQPSLANSDVKNAIALYPDCKKELRNFVWEKESLADLNLKSNFMSSYKEPTQPFYKQTWFAVAATAVVVGLVYYTVQKQKGESSAPSSTVIGEF